MSDYIIVKSPKKRRFRDSKEEYQIPDLDEVYRERKESLDRLVKVMEEYKKLDKKEDKKPQGKTFTFTEGLLLAFIFQYTLGPMISAALKAQGLH